ncbi:IclR family transcriptional regulator C-terminal domain-containing protein [Nonomuraea sp. NPDC050310]|uniref:IclR family transcriptional regulator domain-containing protein n=1 Tax=Nonomuraea sp. NPDC050310 TaxID=3154935 RepID=UPI0033F1B9A9
MEPHGALERGLSVLRALAAAPGCRLRATDLVQATGLARATVDRVLATLVHLGHLRAEGKDVLLAPRLLELGAAYLAAGGLPALDRPAAELAERLDESVSLAVLDGDSVRFVARHTRRRAMAVSLRVGDLLPADRCAAGLVLLDPALRWAVDDQLVEPGLIAVAAPVRAPGGDVVYALSVTSHTSRHTAAELREHALPYLTGTVAAMETALASPAPGADRPVATADRSREPKGELGASYLQSLARGLGVLTALGGAPGGLTLAEAAVATGLPRATVRRAVQTLAALGYVRGQHRFAPAPRVLELGYAHLSGQTLAQLVQPHLAALAARVGESASVAVLSGDDVLYVARVPTTSIMSVDITVGTRFPAHATSMGRVLLAAEPPERLAALTLTPLTRRTLTDPGAFAAAVRQAEATGYAVVDQELEEGVRSIAVPLHSGDGRVVAAVNVATHASRAPLAHLTGTILPELREAARRMEADLAHLPPAR